MKSIGCFIEWANNNTGILGLLFSFVVTSSTVLYVVLTHSLVQETKRMREVAVDPDIAAYLEPNRGAINLIDLIIKNIGNGPAYNVSFSIKQNEPIRKEIKFFETSFINNGIKYLAPNQEFRIYFGSALELFADPGVGTINLAIKYFNNSRSVKNEAFELNINDFKGMMSISNSPLFEIADALNKIANDLHNTIGPEFRIKVNTKTENEIEHSNQEFLKNAKQELENMAKK